MVLPHSEATRLKTVTRVLAAEAVLKYSTTLALSDWAAEAESLAREAQLERAVVWAVFLAPVQSDWTTVRFSTKRRWTSAASAPSTVAEMELLEKGTAPAISVVLAAA